MQYTEQNCGRPFIFDVKGPRQHVLWTGRCQAYYIDYKVNSTQIISQNFWLSFGDIVHKYYIAHYKVALKSWKSWWILKRLDVIVVCHAWP